MRVARLADLPHALGIHRHDVHTDESANGGIPATLHHSGAELKLPDRIRLRADGTNEVVGIIPDALVPWRTRDSRHQRAAKAVRTLDSIVK